MTPPLTTEVEREAMARSLADRMWSYCDVLRDAGVSAIDYVEQLTYLLFLKMAEERAALPAALGGGSDLPSGISWAYLRSRQGKDLERDYRHALEELAKQPGVLGVIYRKAQNRVQDPALLKKLISDLMDKQQWSGHGTDVNGDAYELLLSRSANDQRSGAGQYFTPRALISAVVEVMRPTPDDTIVDPACGTGGFLLEANKSIRSRFDTGTLRPEQRTRLRDGTAFRGAELVDGTARLGVMNLYLHGMVGPKDDSPIDVRDALATAPREHASMVLANPPFGIKSSITAVGENGKTARGDIAYKRQDFWETTTNKQLNFVQHIARQLDMDGRAAVVLPDNVLFEGGAGERIRARLLREYDVHTLLRLPTGIFYAGGVKANVLFFDRRRPRETPQTKHLWVYDFRSDQHFTLKQRPMRRTHLQDFVDSYQADDRSLREEAPRFRCFSYDELMARDKVNLDITWRSEAEIAEADSTQPPEVIAGEITDELQAALGEVTAITEMLHHRDEQS